MRFTLLFLGIIIVGVLGHQIFPWWIIALVSALLAAGFRQKGGVSFLAGFLAAALLWGGYATYLNHLNEGLMADRMGELFGGMSGFLLVLTTGLFGGILGGLGALTGSLGRQLLR